MSHINAAIPPRLTANAPEVGVSLPRMMNTMTHEMFFKEHFNDIKQTEQYILDQIKNILEPINSHRDTNIAEHTTSRIKTPGSTIEKLLLAGYEPTEENALNILSDVIGVRLVVHFLGDIYTIRNLLVNSGKMVIIKEKDYVRNAKPSGYRGYHIIIETNVNGFKTRVEIQLRTIAMDCWASLEHQMRYKKVVKNTELIDSELKKCADDLMSSDIAMEQIFELIKRSTEEESDDDKFFEDAIKCLHEGGVL